MIQLLIMAVNVTLILTAVYGVLMFSYVFLGG